jgi:hypothetical protein
LFDIYILGDIALGCAIEKRTVLPPNTDPKLVRAWGFSFLVLLAMPFSMSLDVDCPCPCPVVLYLCGDEVKCKALKMNLQAGSQ